MPDQDITLYPGNTLTVTSAAGPPLQAGVAEAQAASQAEQAELLAEILAYNAQRVGGPRRQGARKATGGPSPAVIGGKRKRKVINKTSKAQAGGKKRVIKYSVCSISLQTRKQRRCGSKSSRKKRSQN